MMQQQRILRVGLPAIVNGKIGLISPVPGTGDMHPKDWFDYKKPELEFIPIQTHHLDWGDEW